MLYLKTLGGLSVEVHGLPRTGAAQRRKTLALLALLAAAGRRGISRDKLAAYLWPESDSEHARNLLKQATHALRRDLNAPELLLGAIEVRLNPDLITSDIATFEEALDQGDLARAVAAYTGPFLDGFYLTNAAEFERWVDETRATLKRRVGEALEALAALGTAAGDTELAVKSWRQLAELSPLSGKAALGLMRTLIAAKDRTAALEFGQTHEVTVRRELGTAPDPAVSQLLAQLRDERDDAAARVGAAPGAPAGGTAGIPSATKVRTRPALLARRLSIAAALVVGAALAVVAGDGGHAARDPHLIAVAPFEVFDSELEPWRDGLAHLLSRNLDGMGPFRSVPPTVAIPRWEGRPDRASAERFRRRTGAGFVLFGDLARVGSDSVRLRAMVVDGMQERTLADFDRVEHADRIGRLADSLSVTVIRTLVPPTSAAYRQLLAPRTTSLLALKAFLRGERYLAQFWLDSAVAAYERATALDTAFAPALSHAGWARTWNLQGAGESFARAASVNRGLSMRDSLMVAYRASPAGPHDRAFYRLVRRQEATLTELLVRFPDDPEVLHEVGEVQFHLGYFWWDSTWNRARRSFDRAIALDSGFALPYVHAVELALSDNDPDGALRYVRGYLAIPSVNRRGAGLHLLSLLLERDHAERPAFTRELARASLSALRRLAHAVRAWPDSAETQVEVARRLVATAESSGADAYNLRFYESLLAGALIFRGHLGEARRLVGDRLEMAGFMQLAHLGAMTPETIEAALARGVHDVGDHALFPWILEAPCYRTLDAALWWASRRDTAKLRRLVRREESLARTPGAAEVAPYAAPVPGFARAALVLARGDTVAALRGFLPDSSCPGAPQRRAMQFRLLAALGRDAEAAWVWERVYDRSVPLMLERARVAERLGDRRDAVKYYDWVARAWRTADPELQPRAAEARAALTRLQTRGRP